MKFARDSSGAKILPTPKARGICYCCEQELVAKCGEVKLHHWAHKSLQECDHWWENETEWHREWKNRFPVEWQEVVKREAVSGEKHIADIYNSSKELVIEFQNSPIKGSEIQAREKYYKRMLWVLNGTRLNFFVIPVGERDEKFARLEARVRAKFIMKYREEKINVQHQVDHLRQEEANIEIQLTNKGITNIEWRNKSLRIDEAISKLQDGLEEKKKGVEELVSTELAVDYYLRENAKRGPDHQYVFFDWRYKNPNWNNATSPVFVDFQNQLFLIKSNYIALAIPPDSFRVKYGQAQCRSISFIANRE